MKEKTDSSEKDSSSTKEKIEKCAVREFLKNGFLGASLRQIVKEAGVTTGAFYKYYPTKEALFSSLVSPHIKYVYSLYDKNYSGFVKKNLSAQKSEMESNACALETELINYIYAHYDIFKIVLLHSEGTGFEKFTHNLVKREEKSTVEFIRLLKENGVDVPEIDEKLIHMISSGFFAGIFEIVVHNMDRKSALENVKKLGEFYKGGWEKLFGVKFE